MSIASINPTSGETIKTYVENSDDEVQYILSSADKEFQKWRKKSLKERIELIKKVESILLTNKVNYAKLMALEMGKPLQQGFAEIEKCALGCRYYVEHAETFLKDEYVETEGSESFISYQPIGVIAGIMPWNYPFWQVFRTAIPTLLAGNAFVLKHSSNVPACALAIEDVFEMAGLPSNLFRTILIGPSKIASVISNPHVKAVTLTGSSRAGASVANEAGKRLKKLVLELGGSDPYIILADADLEKAAKICATSRMINGGQSCIAAKRFIVEESVFQDFTGYFVNEMKSYVMADPFDEGCRLGPMARIDLRDDLHKQVQKSVDLGAQVLLGGEVPNRKGAFYPSTVLTNVKKGMPAYEDELFGPVASIIVAKDESDAIRLANDTIYGLGAAIFTKDFEKGKRIARNEIEAGCCFVNDFVRSDPRLPFGGIKESGYGRELSYFGIREFTNAKTVYIA
ncbi:MAG: succinate-semialdehyde dehydrogenase [Verrucomicrobia bacterium]|nr:MAG: succinate-semialdehyde dehydrogenase [Verrucomicrobiota bacterium]